MTLLGLLQWRPRLEPVWCGVLIVGAALWLGWVYRRLLRRTTVARARWLLMPKLVVLGLLFLALFDPVSALVKKETAHGKLLAVLDTSSSMDVVDDFRQSRLARARQIVADWRKQLPAGVALDELEFDTTLHPPRTPPPGSALRGTDLAGCLLALADRADISSYFGVVLLTDGGDEAVESAAAPPVPLSIIALGTDPSTWNDVAVAEVQHPATAERNVAIDLSADLVVRAGGGRGFAQNLSAVNVRLERQNGPAWERVAEQNLDLTRPRPRARFSVTSPSLGVQHFRLSAGPVPGELSPLNNTRTLTVNVQQKALHVLYFLRELGPEFKAIRHEIARDPGMTFTALFRTVGERFQLQGERLPGDAALEGGFPADQKTLAAYDCVILGSFPATELASAQRQALRQYVDAGGAVVFLGGDRSFGRGGYTRTELAPLFPWRLVESEPEPLTGRFAVSVPPVAAGHPILATVEELLAQAGATLESVNQVAETKAGATPLLNGRFGDRILAVVVLQPYGRGKVLAIASNTLWKWSVASEPLPTAYGVFWRQALRFLTGKSEGGQNLAVQWDKESYRPGERARAILRSRTPSGPAGLRFGTSLVTPSQTNPLSVEAMPEQPGTFTTEFLFRQRGEYTFRLVAYRGNQVFESYEKSFAVAPLLPEGSRLEVDEVFLKKIAERSGGVYLRENDAAQFLPQVAAKLVRRTTLSESSWLEAGPWFAALFLAALVAEWVLRRRLNLF